MLYLETSAMLKKYRQEQGTDAVRKLLDSGERAASSILTLLEIEAALGRLFRGKYLSREQLSERRAILLKDWDNVRVVELGVTIADLVRRLVVTHPLRAGDAIHLASALLLAGTRHPITFCSSDASLLRSAAAEGLPTWNPLSP